MKYFVVVKAMDTNWNTLLLNIRNKRKKKKKKITQELQSFKSDVAVAMVAQRSCRVSILRDTKII